MSARTFIDTNVFVYLLDDRDPIKTAVAERLTEVLALRGTGVISYQVEQEFFNVAFRSLAKPLQPEDAAAMDARIFSTFERVESSHELLLRAIWLKKRYRLPWYDSLIVAAALEAGCEVLCSEDFQDAQVFEGSLTVVNPFAMHKS